jgi:hypothetical protein
MHALHCTRTGKSLRDGSTTAVLCNGLCDGICYRLCSTPTLREGLGNGLCRSCGIACAAGHRGDHYLRRVPQEHAGEQARGRGGELC